MQRSIAEYVAQRWITLQSRYIGNKLGVRSRVRVPKFNVILFLIDTAMRCDGSDGLNPARWPRRGLESPVLKVPVQSTVASRSQRGALPVVRSRELPHRTAASCEKWTWECSGESEEARACFCFICKYCTIQSRVPGTTRVVKPFCVPANLSSNCMRERSP